MRLKFITSLALTLVVLGAYSQVDISETRSRFGLGISGGVTFGDLSDAYSSNLGVDVIYMYSLSERFHLGTATGFTNYFGKEFDSEDSSGGSFSDIQFLPVAASLRVSPFRNFMGGADVGYTIGLDGVDGGFYVSPRATYLLKNRFPIYMGYRMISLDSQLNSIQWGIGYIIK